MGTSRHLKGGRIISCGCNIREHTILRNTSHGLHDHPLYNVWQGMKGRCYYKKHMSYIYYGANGITVCDEWKNNFKCFYDWALLNGWAENLVLDRKKNHFGYNPSNCRFVTFLESGRNMTNNRKIEYNGVSKCVSEWAEQYGVRTGLIYERMNKLGWTFEKALLTKSQRKLHASAI